MELIPIRHGKIALWRDGEGSPVLFLHGGPGDTHHYMRRMSQPLQGGFQCVSYDQRGVGASVLDGADDASQALRLHFEDLLAIRDHLGIEKLTLVGHSWGAMLALYFNIAHPECVERAALVSMGPLDEAGEAVCNARLMAALSEGEKSEWMRLRKLRGEALEKGRQEEAILADRELMALRVKSWVFDPSRREAFLEEYFRDPPPDRKVNGLAYNASRGFFRWEDLARIGNPLWVCYGEQDFAPVGQAGKLKERVPSALVTFLPECGHIPWLEQAEAFYGRLQAFLEGSTC